MKLNSLPEGWNFWMAVRRNSNPFFSHFCENFALNLSHFRCLNHIGFKTGSWDIMLKIDSSLLCNSHEKKIERKTWKEGGREVKREEGKSDSVGGCNCYELRMCDCACMCVQETEAQVMYVRGWVEVANIFKMEVASLACAWVWEKKLWRLPCL